MRLKLGAILPADRAVTERWAGGDRATDIPEPQSQPHMETANNIFFSSEASLGWVSSHLKPKSPTKTTAF